VDVPRLTRLLESPNAITDDEGWLARNDFDRPGDPASPARALPFLYRGEARIRVVESGAWTLGVYGPPSAGRYLLVAGDGGLRRAFDFAAYRRAPSAQAGDEAFVEQDLAWAAAAGGWLYVAHAHRTYAASSGGMNGYVTALDLASGALRWRSRPRVANAATFALVGDALVTGYGFTAEPDFLYVLDRFTGEVIEEERVRTAPTWLLVRGDRLFVRAYDADYVYALR
jgi:outer membrane protein assembly factor BamB